MTKQARSQADYDTYKAEQLELQSQELRVEHSVLYRGRVWHKTKLGYVCSFPKHDTYFGELYDVPELEFHYLVVDRLSMPEEETCKHENRHIRGFPASRYWYCPDCKKEF